MTTTPPPSLMSSPLPQWWDPHIAHAWTRARPAVLERWSASRLRAAATTPADPSIVEHALAFGHGARHAYARLATWEAIAPTLQHDWTRLGYVGPAAWHHVAEIVRYEWELAAAAGADA